MENLTTYTSNDDQKIHQNRTNNMWHESKMCMYGMVCCMEWLIARRMLIWYQNAAHICITHKERQIDGAKEIE